MKNVGTLRACVSYTVRNGKDWYVASIRSKKVRAVQHGAETARLAVSGLLPYLKDQDVTGTVKPVLKLSKRAYEAAIEARQGFTHRKGVSREEVAEAIRTFCTDGREVPLDFLIDTYFNEVDQIRDGVRSLRRDEQLSWVSLSIRHHLFEIAMLVSPEDSTFIRPLQARLLAARAIHNLLSESSQKGN